jgi:hypothetical protein
MLRRSPLVECVSVLPGNRCLQNVEFFFLRYYVQPCFTGAWGMDFVSSSPFSLLPPLLFSKFSYKSFLFQNFHNHSFFLHKKNSTFCKHRFPGSTLTHSTNEDLLNIKRKGYPEVSYPLSYVRYH